MAPAAHDADGRGTGQPFRGGRPLWKQREVAAFYSSFQVQILVALLIGANFLTNIVEKEIDPKGDNHKDVFKTFELVYNILFTVELLINLYGHWFCNFFSSAWNVFDCLVVIIGVINTIQLPLPKPFSLLRMMRAFRVFRLFKRVPSLNKIIATIIYAIPGVMNAFLILAIVMSIYAILAVEFFRNVYSDCRTTDIGKTPRGNCVGEENFGRFSFAFYSMFQVFTGESWAEAIGRPTMFSRQGYERVATALFFVSFYFITSYILGNVVVAVLLNKMQDPDIVAEALEAAENPDGLEEDVGGQMESAKDPDSIYGRLERVDYEVTKISTLNRNIQTQLDASKREMALVRTQMDTILQLIQAASNGNG